MLCYAMLCYAMLCYMSLCCPCLPPSFLTQWCGWFGVVCSHLGGFLCPYLIDSSAVSNAVIGAILGTVRWVCCAVLCCLCCDVM